LVGFGRALRDEGLDVGTDRIASFCSAAALVPAEQLYWAGRATLVAREQDVDVYDRVFLTFFGAEQRPPERARVRERVGAAAREELRALLAGGARAARRAHAATAVRRADASLAPA
jgi:uncharacterized protein with von Willebrand factor type A (vWA) domain